MATSAKRRLIQDLQKMKKNTNLGIQAMPNQDNLFQWDSYIEGPEDTIWEGGVFRLKITFGQDYPNNAPKIVFVSKMFHPNIYNDGNICLDTMQKQWSPFYDVQAFLTSIRSLLPDPNTESPANQQAAQLFKNNRSEYQKRVKQIVELSWISKITIQEEQKN